MKKTIVIDASVRENTRIAKINNLGRLEDLALEDLNKKSIKSNIYLGVIDRVVPSVQAAFVVYGGERNGFLPYSEIHPDYFNIPGSEKKESERTSTTSKESKDVDDKKDFSDLQKEESHFRLRSKHKIQDVIKNGIRVLVQVSRNERGEKGVSLTTYVSLSGRYCVLMPNFGEARGVSRKISDPATKKKMTKLVESIDLTPGSGIVVRTAATCTTQEKVINDYANLVDLWNDIRKKALKSNVGALLYEEGNIYHQMARDMYDDDVKAIHVNSQEAKSLCLDALSSYSIDAIKKVVLYSSKSKPIFSKYGVEKAIDMIFSTKVPLPSGGYIVIQQTEALVAIDVNSGRDTSSGSIEEMALKINLEAADEIVNQLILREMGGLIVIDFIDMENQANRNEVYNKLRNCFSRDRARYHMSKISPFGLVEVSRQRLKTGLFDMITLKCEHCNGSGLVRSEQVLASKIYSIRHLIESKTHKYESIKIYANPFVVSKMLDDKTIDINQLESEWGIDISFVGDKNLIKNFFEIKGVKKNGSESLIFAYNDNLEDFNKSSKVATFYKFIKNVVSLTYLFLGRAVELFVSTKKI